VLLGLHIEADRIEARCYCPTDYGQDELSWVATGEILEIPAWDVWRLELPGSLGVMVLTEQLHNLSELLKKLLATG
jgi:hypothetical protein